MIKAWLKKRREDKLQHSLEEGFSWCMCAYYLHKETTEYISLYLSNHHYPLNTEFDKEFDKGVRLGVATIYENDINIKRG